MLSGRNLSVKLAPKAGTSPSKTSRSRKMPTPSDIRLILAGRLSDRIEHQAIADKSQFAAGAQRILTDRRIGQEHLAKIREILSRKPAEPDDWWHKLMIRWRAGEQLAWMQMVNTRLAWEKSGRPQEWAPPGTPDAELIAERSAIQAEGNACADGRRRAARLLAQP